jgi:hypothetical protein
MGIELRANRLEEVFSETRWGYIGNDEGNDEAPGLFTEGFYRYSVLSSSLNVSNHHPNLLAQWFIFCLRDRLEPLRVLAV